MLERSHFVVRFSVVRTRILVRYFKIVNVDDLVNWGDSQDIDCFLLFLLVGVLYRGGINWT
jgi:hypothetical protein